MTIASEIDSIERFSDPEKLKSYAGLVPSVRNSADVVHHGHITKRGSRMLRWVLVESIHSHVLHAPKSDIAIFYKRLAKKRGNSKAVVAAAAKMLKVIYWLLKDGRDFEQNYS
ncbi:MAG: Transposase [Cenarchaeum symbiont of Oopsacas minuta]|nr:Transposase [Cenarchaeum symbiont of Oopsacas minuta]